MSDDNQQDPDGLGAGGGDATGDETPPTGDRDFEAEIKKLRAENAKHRTRNKELSAAAERLAELEDANKSKEDKLAEQATAAQQRAEAAEAKLIRLEVAADKGLSRKLAARLQGTTREELEADADDLLADFSGDSGNGPAPKSRTTPNLRPGGSGGDDDLEELDPAKLAAAIPRR